MRTQETRLRLNDFSFHGFDDSLDQLETQLNQLRVRAGSPRAVTVTDAVFVPTVEVAPSHYEGCLVTSDGQPIPTAQSRREIGAFGKQTLGTLSQPVELAPGRTVDETVVYLGGLYEHFGHFLLETLGRTWILDQIDPSLRVVFHFERKLHPTGTLLRLLELFGVPLDRILILDADSATQTLLRRVIVPEALYEISYAAHDQMVNAYRSAAHRVIGDVEPYDQPVYLSRRLLGSSQRPIVGELQMEEVFRENGFHVAHPEQMSIEDQIRLVNRHADIVTSAGSAAYLTLFANRPSRLHLLTDGIPFLDYFLMPKAIQATASYIDCLAGGHRGLVHNAPHWVDMEKLESYLDSRGWLKSRLRSSLAARHNDHRDEYDELRCYGALRTALHGQPILPEVESEALDRSQSSWPLCWILARYYLDQNSPRIEQLVQRFVELVGTESDPARLAYFYDDVAGPAIRIARRCTPSTNAKLTSVLLNRFGIDLVAERARRKERRRLREAESLNGGTDQPHVAP